MKNLSADNRFYVYVYLDPRKPGKYIYGNYSFDYEPFYIGKGTGYRKTGHLTESSLKHNSHKNNKIKKILKDTNEQPEIITLKNNLLEQDAFNLEIKLVALIGRKNLNTGPLTNLTDAGEGASGTIVSNETKLKHSQNTSGEKNPMFGQKGEFAPGYGRKMSDKEKKHLSDMKKGIYVHAGKIISEETRKKLGDATRNKTYEEIHGIEKAKKLKNNRSESNKKRKFYQTTKDKIAEKNSKKTWKLTSPTGEIIIIKNLNKFCKENNLTNTLMHYVSQGKQKQHKGWKCDLVN